MSQFYARYIPTNTSILSISDSNVKRPATSKLKHKSKRRKTEKPEDEDERQSNSAKVEDTSTTVVHRTKQQELSEQAEATSSKNDGEISVQAAVGNRLAGRKRKTSVEAQTEPDDNEAEASRHSKILSRFSKSKEKAAWYPRKESDKVTNHNSTTQASLIHDLEPLPQPRSIPVNQSAPTYSTAPEWLRNPITVDHNKRRPFIELGVHKILLQILKSQEKDIALPVQSAVLPLLLDKFVDQRSDLCVAAATGSGKTLAYILPILQDLRTRKLVRLRAVVVVPTRSLVKQVTQVIDTCSTGIDLRIGTAEGSRTLAEEQRQLVEEKLVYDPKRYRKEQESPVDWSTFSLEDAVEHVGQRDRFSGVGYVTDYFSKVDVLVCTPGRLVEHLQSTKGFNLDYVQWFVVDEADRLLNESYHDWLEVVLPALKSQRPTEQRNHLLRYMYMDVPSRRVTKILLSATMTKDISQLLNLDLTDPKLVMVEDTETQTDNVEAATVRTDFDAEYSLPARLRESAIAFKDSENKPLYLLELLVKHVFNQDGNVIDVEDGQMINRAKRGASANTDETSSSVSSSDEAGQDATDFSSSAGTDSESDTISISSSSSSASSSSSSSDSTPSSPVLKSTLPEGTSQPRVLIFTKSTESAHRLSRLLSLLSPALSHLIATFTRSSSSSSTSATSKKLVRSLLRTRAEILQSFNKGTSRILISTDLAARGLDIPLLEHVINYDVPSSALMYVHRVGRTARAGMEGQAWTLVEHKQGKWFWETIGGKGVKDGEKRVLGRGKRVVQKVNIVLDKEEWMDKYEDALKKLGEDVRA